MLINKNEGLRMVTLGDLQAGDLFSYNEKVWMKITPVNFIGNSSLIQEVLNRGDFLAVALEDGGFSAWTRKALVRPVKGYFTETR